MPRHDRSHGVYHAPGSKGGSRRRKVSIKSPSGARRARKSTYAIKQERRSNTGQ